MDKKFYCIILLWFICQHIFAQLNVNSGMAPESLVDRFVGDGVQFSNVSFTGIDVSRGYFSGGETTNLGLNSGVVLSNGEAEDVMPTSFSNISGHDLGLPGDPVLDAMCGFPTSDAVVLEFDFVPLADTIICRFVFASNEYAGDAYVYGSYNDVFGYFLSGPRPGGGDYNHENIALVPGTNSPISIKTINNAPPKAPNHLHYPVNPEYYVDNDELLTVRQKGFTVILTAVCHVVPCETYHIKFALADATDAKYDSNIFLEEGSFSAKGILPQVSYFPETKEGYMTEGCVAAHVEMVLSKRSATSWKMPFTLGGSATNKDDYAGIPDTLVVPPMASSVSFDVHALLDAQTEGDENIQIIYPRYRDCSPVNDTFYLSIHDREEVKCALPDDFSVCHGENIEVEPQVWEGTPPYTYQWSDGSTEKILKNVPDVTTEYTFSVTDVCGSTMSESIKVTVNPLPVIALGDDVAKCEKESVKLDAGSGFASYLWSNGSHSSFINVVNPGLYWVEVENIFGCSARDTIFVLDNLLPNPDLGDDKSVCPYQMVDLSPGTGFSYYQWNNGATTPGITTLEEGLFWVKVTDDKGCQNSDTVVVTHLDVPDIELGENDTVCAGTPVVLSLPLGYASYVWQDGTQGYEYAVEVTGDYKVVVTNDVGCVSKDSVYIQVNPVPVISIGEDVEQCAPASLMLSPGNGFQSYLWQDGSTNVLYKAKVTGQYHVTVTNDFNCAGSDTMNLLVYPQPVVSLGDDQVICEEENVLLDPGPFATYLWQDGTSTPTYTATVTGQYHLLATDANGCEGRDTMQLLVNPLPKLNLGDDRAICAGGSLLISAGLGYSSYTWQDGSHEQSFLAKDEGWYWVEVTTGQGCAKRDSLYLTLNPLPDIELGNDTVICQGTSFLLQPGSGYAGYTWHDGSIWSEYHVHGAGTYYVTVYNEFGCLSSDTIHVETMMGPVVDLGQDTAICHRQKVTLDAGNGYSAYYWNTGEVTQQIQATSQGWHWVKVTDASTCAGYDSLYLTVKSLPVVELPPFVEICAGDSLLLQAPDNMLNYLWSDGSTQSQCWVKTDGQHRVMVTAVNGCSWGDTTILANRFIQKPDLGEDRILCQGDVSWLNAGKGYSHYLWDDGLTKQERKITIDGIYGVKVYDDLGCMASDSCELIFNPAPDVFIGNDTAITCGTMKILTAITDVDEYYWSTGETTRQITVEGNQTITIAVGDMECPGRDTINIGYNNMCRVDVPTAFSPNGDGQNDYLCLASPGIAEFELRIYDRYGKLIFHSYDPYARWDGTWKGEPCPMDAYLFYVTGMCENRFKFSQTGDITLIR